LASKRAHQLLKGAEPLVKAKTSEIVTALREIAAGKVVYANPEYLKGSKEDLNRFRIVLNLIGDEEYIE